MQYITNRVAICYSFTFKKQMKHVFKIYKGIFKNFLRLNNLLISLICWEFQNTFYIFVEYLYCITAFGMFGE